MRGRASVRLEATFRAATQARDRVLSSLSRCLRASEWYAEDIAWSRNFACCSRTAVSSSQFAFRPMTRSFKARFGHLPIVRDVRPAGEFMSKPRPERYRAERADGVAATNSGRIVSSRNAVLLNIALRLWYRTQTHTDRPYCGYNHTVIAECGFILERRSVGALLPSNY